MHFICVMSLALGLALSSGCNRAEKSERELSKALMISVFDGDGASVSLLPVSPMPNLQFTHSQQSSADRSLIVTLGGIEEVPAGHLIADLQIKLAGMDIKGDSLFVESGRAVWLGGIVAPAKTVRIRIAIVDVLSPPILE